MAVKSAAQCGVRKANILELGGVLSLSEADELERSIAEGRIAMRKRLKHLGRQLCGQAL